MSQILAPLMRWPGFSMTPSKTRPERYLRRLNQVIVVLALLYLGLQIFPQTLFAHHVTADHITFYSHQPLPADIAACATRARGLLERSELAAPERAERIFLCDSPWLFTLFNPISTRAFAFPFL